MDPAGFEPTAPASLVTQLAQIVRKERKG